MPQHIACPAEDIETTVRDAVRDAIKEGFTHHMTDDRVRHMTRIAIGELREHLTTTGGRFLLGSLGSLLARVALFLIAGLLVYSLNGWTGIAALLKSITGVDK